MTCHRSGYRAPGTNAIMKNNTRINKVFYQALSFPKNNITFHQSYAEASPEASGTKHTSLVSPRTRLIQTFCEWLDKTKDAKIVLKRKDADLFNPGTDDFIILNYLHRFKEEYMVRVLSKFGKVFLHFKNRAYVHVTLTSYHNCTVTMAIENLKRGFNNLRSYLYRKHGKIPYLSVLEPHEDGYPHLHVLFFTPKYLIKHSELTFLWQKYGVGRIVYLKRYWNWGRDPRGLWYLSKHLSKFYRDIPEVLSWYVNQSRGTRKFLDKIVEFFAWIWYCKFKTYSFSRELSVLWVIKRKSSGEWELLMFVWDSAILEAYFRLYELRYDHKISDFYSDNVRV